MKKRFSRILSMMLAMALLLAGPALAHSGRTDSKGGHKDNKNKSGLGYYHYHCGGHPAHLHDGGVCPYASSSSGSTSNSKNNSSKTETKSSATTSKSTSSQYEGDPIRKVTEIQLFLPKGKVTVGSVISITTHVSPWNATDRTLVWSSDNEAVAIVMADGTVVIIGAGSANITASARDGSNTQRSVSIEVASNVGEGVDAEHIRAQLPADKVFLVAPGSAAARFVMAYGLPYEYLLPSDLPLSIGSRGETVKEIQAALIALGYLDDKADGIFGKKTDAAVADFCADNWRLYFGSVDADRYIAIMEAANE